MSLLSRQGTMVRKKNQALRRKATQRSQRLAEVRANLSKADSTNNGQAIHMKTFTKPSGNSSLPASPKIPASRRVSLIPKTPNSPRIASTPNLRTSYQTASPSRNLPQVLVTSSLKTLMNSSMRTCVTSGSSTTCTTLSSTCSVTLDNTSSDTNAQKVAFYATYAKHKVG